MSARIPTPSVVLQSPRLAEKGLRYISDDEEVMLHKRFTDLGIPEAPAMVSLPTKTFSTKGYYVGKKLLDALFAHDFADCEGVEISFGIEPDAIGGRLVLLFRGAYKETAANTETDFKHMSTGSCMATYHNGIGGGAPDPPIIRNPPYGK